jgi:hypothetical protein
MLKELAQMMRENEFLVDRRSVFKNCKYIIVVALEKGTEAGNNAWDGQMGFLKKYIKFSMNKQSYNMRKMERALTEKIDSQNSEFSKSSKLLEKKFTKLDHHIDNKFNSLEAKLDRILSKK